MNAHSLSFRYARSVFGAFVGLTALVLVAGCGAGGAGRRAVSGTVTFKGAPLPQGTIEFEPEEKSTATTMEGGEIRDGKYTLDAKQGLTPGKYQVRISSFDEKQKASAGEEAPGQGTEPKNLIPKQYNEESTLKAEVLPKDPNTFNFDLK